MENEEKIRVKIINGGKPNPNLFCEVGEEAMENEFGELKLSLYVRNDGERMATVTEKDVHAFALPDGQELGISFDEEKVVRILPGHEREVCLVVEEPGEYLVVSVNDKRDAEPEQLIECEITGEAIEAV